MKHFKKLIPTTKDINLEADFLFLPGHERAAKDLAELMKKSMSSPGYDASLERQIGSLLGYSQLDIEMYIQNLKDLGRL
ncbi:hypothetical protein CF392_02095 [Tamilnaduibacter salinus]|uniref:Uncharacterized protein n=1 Tax=Tamilnaduibacter salinus TaxID=1484056 RepID=A0A2A2I6P2_9GAMM|nr:hypothetical protein CF392_02095 [Tamilnaduibacter salinus]